MVFEKFKNESKNNDDETYSYTEECALVQACGSCSFDKNSKFLYIISANVVIAFDVHSGQRGRIFQHQNELVGQTFYNGMMITLTKASELNCWNVEDGELIEQFKLGFSDAHGLLFTPIWFYQANEKHFILGFNSVKGESALFQIQLGDVVQKIGRNNSKNDEQRVIQTKMIVKISLDWTRPIKREHLAIGDGFCVHCDRKVVKMIKFDAGTGRGKNCSEIKLPKHNEFTLNSQFDVANQDLVEFDAVCIAGDHLFASLNVGRICSWSNFKKDGLASSNLSFITLTGHQSIICAPEQGGSLYVGTGKSVLYKYNLEGTSGVGRWHRLEFLQLDAPPRALFLSADSSMLCAILSDNSVIVFQTANMKIMAKAEVLNSPQMKPLSEFRFGLVADPINAKLLISNARFGHLQWINPFRWKTVKQFDVAQENPPHEDTFNMPDVLWLNTYLICATPTVMVTCECRRNDSEKTYLKFWRRETFPSSRSAAFELEDCFTLQKRLQFVRPSMDEDDNFTEEQEFLCVNSTGDMDAYTMDTERSGHWCRALGRHWQNWQRVKVKSCSRIREQTFGTVNALNESTSICCIWNFDKMGALRVLESLVAPNQIEWSPQPGIFLIACNSGIVAFDRSKDAFLWAILQPGVPLSISSTHLCTFAYSQTEVFIIDPENGVLKRDPLEFGRAQAEIIPLQRNGRLCFCGITKEGSLSLLKPKTFADEEEGEKEEKTNGGQNQQPTAFSRLKSNNRQKKKENKEAEAMEIADDALMEHRQMWKNVTLRKFIDGPGHSLPPIAHLANKFVESCLARSTKRE